MLNSNTIIPRKVVNMTDVYAQKAVEHNDLITSVAKMDKVPLKIFELAVSCLDTENPPEDNTVYLSKETLFSFFKVNDSDKYFRFKKSLTILHQQSIFQVREKNTKGKWKYKIISPLESTEWSNDEDAVEIKFTNSIMPYLIDLKKNFTQYLITDIMNLNSKYGIILYKWFSMNFNQYENYKDNLQRRKDQLEQLKNPYIDIQELRRMTNTLEEYERFDHFETRVLKTAINEITEHTHFKVTYEKVKKGRKIVGIQFYIEKKPSKAKLPYKEGSEKAKQSQEEREKENKVIYDQALISKYTKELVQNQLIESIDILDIRFMVRLSKTVFPLYDEIQNRKGLKGVATHISYVKGNMIDYENEKKNIIKYLRISAEDYIRFIKTDEL